MPNIKIHMNGCVFQAAYLNKIYRMNDFFKFIFCEYVGAGVHRDQKRARDSPELERL